MNDDGMGHFLAFVCGALAALLVFLIITTCTGSTPGEVQKRWCAEMFAAPHADTLAVLRMHDFCTFPRPK